MMAIYDDDVLPGFANAVGKLLKYMIGVMSKWVK